MTNDNSNLLAYSVEQARRRLGVSRGLMYEAIRQGRIPSFRILGRILIPRVALEAMLNQQANTPSDQEIRETGE